MVWPHIQGAAGHIHVILGLKGQAFQLVVCSNCTVVGEKIEFLVALRGFLSGYLKGVTVRTVMSGGEAWSLQTGPDHMQEIGCFNGVRKPGDHRICGGCVCKDHTHRWPKFTWPDSNQS